MRCGPFFKALPMDFIKSWFGISPDHGDRSFEVLSLVMLVAMITVLAWRFFHKLSDKS
jgi:hypothetical protein